MMSAEPLRSSAVTAMMLRITLQIARDDYEGRRERQHQGIAITKRDNRYQRRKPNTFTLERISELRSSSPSIVPTARLAGCSETQVKRVWRAYIERENPGTRHRKGGNPRKAAMPEKTKAKPTAPRAAGASPLIAG